MFQRQKIVWSAFPLSMYIPLLLACAVIFPLLITIISSEVLSRPALITQSSAVMETDAQARIQLIDAYFVERLKDIQTVSQFTPCSNSCSALPLDRMRLSTSLLAPSTAMPPIM